MKKTIISIFFIAFCLLLTGCTETASTNQDGKLTKEFTVGETATVNNTKIKINSIKKITEECSFEWDGKCESYTKPDNDYFLLFDITIENTGSNELNISSIMSFDLKDDNGEKGNLEITLDAINSSLDNSIMANDKLKGQIAYDVKDSEKYYLYYQDSLIDDNIKFIINKSDITE